MSNLFAVRHVSQLDEIQQARLKRNQPGIGLEVEELIRRLTSGGVAGKSDDWQVVQAKRYWDLGIGRELGKRSFEKYLASIPKIPDVLQADDPRFPYLVLVEPRLGLAKLCAHGNISFGGYEGDLRDDRFVNYDDGRLIHYDERHAEFVRPIWIRIQDGRKNRNRAVSECRRKFAKDELGLTALQGVCAYLQHHEVVTDKNKGTEEHVMSLPGSYFHPKSAALLQLIDGEASLSGYVEDCCSAAFGAASRQESKG